MWKLMCKFGLRYAKRSLMSWVVVIPKEGRACGAAPALLLAWHRLFRLFFLGGGKFLIFFGGKIFWFFFLVFFFKFFINYDNRVSRLSGLQPSLFWFEVILTFRHNSNRYLRNEGDSKIYKIKLHELFTQFTWTTIGLRYAKRSLMSWIVVIPKEWRARGAAPALLLVWHWLFRFFGGKNFFWKKFFDFFFLVFFFKFFIN